MTFEQLLARLLKEVAGRIQNGQFTERGLARMSRLSQPHVHHILKGKRGMTPEVADRFLQALGMEADDLFGKAEAEERMGPPQGESRCTLLPVLDGLVGPADPAPSLQRGELYFPFPESLLPRWTAELPQGGMSVFVVVRLGRDELLPESAGEHDLLVLSLAMDGPRSAAEPTTQGKPAIWEYRGSWIFDAPQKSDATARTADPRWAERRRQLRTEGRRVADVLWWIRRLHSASLGDGLVMPEEED